jgi:rhodanese-related sulfurtransferase
MAWMSVLNTGKVAVLLVVIHISLFAQSEIEVTPKTFDFGTVQEGVNVPVNFRITNSGKHNLKVKEIRTFAACVETQPIKKRQLRPGEYLDLQYEFESLGYGGVDIEKKIEVIHNRSSDPLILQVKGRIKALKSHQVPFGEMVYNFFILIDIRPFDRFQQEHILGAIHIPSEEIIPWVKRVASRFSEELVVYLYSEDGSKSDEIAIILQGKGYHQFVSLVGGFREWKRQYKKKWVIGGER